MESERWEQIETLFFGALERDGAERTAFLKAACPGNPNLWEEIEAMLSAHEESATLLIEKKLLSGRDVTDEDPHAILGARVGPYRLSKLLGEGGMGLVYLAQRDDDHYRHDVALKLIRPGLRTTEIVTRFRVERQILARFQHPNIARLLDGGMTEDGRPYLVMEYIEGIPITEFCDAERLTIRQRLHLFVTICRAVQFAHRNLVVHRDLKPTNILVSEEREVKLLDFGIAKLLDPSSANISVAQTRADLRVMTPEYGAPEQVRGEAVTTATDIYALGLLLYELLSGHRPYGLTGKSPSEVERIICESEPQRPSTAVMVVEETPRSDGTTEVLTPARVSADRATLPARLRRRLKGDLDNIVMMALRKEPDRRYASADQLAEDVTRYLNRQVVIARKGTLSYRMSTFVRRHRAGVGVAAAILVLLVSFSTVTVWQAQMVVRERDIARAERDRSEQALLQAEEVSEFLMGLFEASDPGEARGDTITARELLERGVARAEELAGQPAVQARMLGVVGQTYRRLGQYEQAQPLLEKAVAQWRELDDAEELARSLNHLGLFFLDQNRTEDAEALLLEADALQKALNPGVNLTTAETLHNLGGLARERGDASAADSLFRAALDIRKAIVGPDHPLTIRTMRMIARGLGSAGSFDVAEMAYREVLEQQRRFFGEVHPDVASTLNDLAILLKEKGDLEAAGSMYQESLTLRRTLYGDRHPRVAVALVNYAKLLITQEDARGAIPLLTEAHSIFREVHGPDHADVAWALENLALAFARSGAVDRAIPAFRQALAIQRQSAAETHPRIATTMISLASSLFEVGQYDEAEDLYYEGLARYLDAFGGEHPDVATVHGHLGRFYHAQDQFADAEHHFRTAVDLYGRVLPEGHRRTATVLLGYGKLLLDMGNPAQAELLLREGLAALPEDSRLVADARRTLAACLVALRRQSEAEPLTAAVP